MWRLKYLLIGMLISGGLGVALFFVGRYVVDQIEEEVRGEAVAAVDDYFVDYPLPSLTEDRVTISEQQLADELQAADEGSDTFNEEGLRVEFNLGRIRILDRDGTNIGSVEPTVVDGRIELGEPSGASRLIPFGLAKTVVDRVELRLAEYFADQGKTPTSIEVTDTQIVVEFEPTPGATPRAAGTPTAAGTSRAGTATPRPGATTTRPAATATRPAATVTPVVRITPVGTRETVPSPSPTRGSILNPLPRTPSPTP